MSHFQTRVKNFFAIRENFFSRRPFGRGQLVGANGFMRLFDPTVKHFSAKNRKNVSEPSKRRFRVVQLCFSTSCLDSTSSPRKSKALHDIFHTICLQYG